MRHEGRRRAEALSEVSCFQRFCEWSEGDQGPGGEIAFPGGFESQWFVFRGGR